MNKVIEFLRVSTEEQSKEGREGLPRQKEANALTIRRHKLSVVRTITLIDVSGTSVLQSPEVNKLLDTMHAGAIDGVVVADWDRLIRLDNFRDFALLEHFKETGTLIYLPDQIIDLNTQSGFLIGGFQSIISGNELTQIKKRMLAAKEIKRKNGEHPNNRNTLPLGVDYDYKEKRFFYTDEAKRVKKLFHLFYEKGIHNYKELERRTGIHHRTISNLLRNEIYTGYRVYTEKRGAEKVLKKDGRQGYKKKVQRSPDEIIRVKVIDKPIVSERVFGEVQEIIRNKNRQYHQRRPQTGERYLYSGFLKCGVCGAIIYTNTGGRGHKKDYYYCSTKNYLNIRKHGPTKCTSCYMQKELVEGTITSFLAEKLTDKDYLMEMIDASLSDDQHNDLQNEAEEVKARLKKLEKKRLKMLDLYGEGLYKREELDKKVNTINDETNTLKRTLLQIESTMLFQDKFLLSQSIQPIVTTLAEFNYWTAKQKRDFLQTQVPTFYITPEGLSSFTLRVCNSGTPVGRGSLRLQA